MKAAGLWAGAPWRRLAAGAALAALTVLCGLALLSLSGWFVTLAALAGLSVSGALAVNVFTPSAAIRLLSLLRTGARYGERLVTHDAMLAALAGLRLQLFRRWSGRGTERRLQMKPARLLSRLGSDVDALDGVYLRLAVPLASALAVALAVGVGLGALADPAVGLASGLALAALAAGLCAVLPRAARSPSLRRAVALEALRSRTIDLASAQAEWLMAGQVAVQRQLALSAEQRLARADDRLNRIDVASGAALSLAGSALLAAMLLAVAVLVDAGRLGLPLGALALFAALAAMEPFDSLRRGAIDAARMRWSLRRLAAAPDAAAPDAVPALALRPGERVALIGASGSGKSMLLNRCAGAHASHLLQRSELFNDTLRENLRLADPQAGDLRLWAALDDAGLGDVVRALPLRLDTRLGEGGSGLSGGQRRRLALARLLLQDRPLWLLDEPTEGVDAGTARDVLARLAVLAHGRTLLVATHLQREAALADRLLVLAHGQVVADLQRGTPAFDTALAALRPD